MTLELRLLSGTRAGARERFEKSVISIGRHPLCDLRFDPQADLDVSTRHAELRGVNGAWTIYDSASTNGTFVNGERIGNKHRLEDGDVVTFGSKGPRMEFRIVQEADAATPPSARDGDGAAVAPAPARKDTSVRVAEAVHAQTKAMRARFMVGVGTLIAAGAIGFLFWQRQTSALENERLALVARAESTMVVLQRRIDATRPRDSLVAAALQHQMTDTKRDLAYARDVIADGRGSRASVEQLAQRMQRRADLQLSLAQMDWSKVHDLNDAAVTMIVADLDGVNTAGTAFGISPSGLLVTNKHVVRTDAGPAKRIGVIYANTNEWIPAHIVRESDTDDLALLQVDVPGRRPVVAGVSRTGDVARVGAPIASIGYPLAIDLPMEGTGLKITARTTTTPGMVSKRLDSILQMDSFAGHGSSGSPVFDAAGNVVGVVYGGAPKSNGRIVYAIPARRLAAFIGADGAGIVR
jgi:S1-C subfamily serine protease